MGKSLSNALCETSEKLMMKKNSSFGILLKQINSPLKYHGKDLENWKGLGRNLVFIRKCISYTISWIMSILRDRSCVKKLPRYEKLF